MYGLPPECVCCACDPSVHLSVPSICLFVFLYSSFRILVYHFIFCSSVVVSKVYDFAFIYFEDHLQFQNSMIVVNLFYQFCINCKLQYGAGNFVVNITNIYKEMSWSQHISLWNTTSIFSPIRICLSNCNSL